MTMEQIPELVWFGRVSRNGILSPAPMRAKYFPDHKLWWVTDNEEYPHLNGNVSVKKLGVDYSKDYHVISFASTKKEEVEYWIRGARATITILRSMTAFSLDSKDILA